MAGCWLACGVGESGQRGGGVHPRRCRQAPSSRRPLTGQPALYIDPQISASMVARAEALGLDPGKLMRLVAELNDNHSCGNAYAAHALLRAAFWPGWLVLVGCW